MALSSERFDANVGVVGLVAVKTCGICWIAVTAAVTAAVSAVPVSGPEGLWNTTWAEGALASGKRCCSRSNACWDSVPGMVKTSLVWPSLCLATTDSRTATTTQAPMTTQWWRAAPRPRRSSMALRRHRGG